VCCFFLLKIRISSILVPLCSIWILETKSLQGGKKNIYREATEHRGTQACVLYFILNFVFAPPLIVRLGTLRIIKSGTLNYYIIIVLCRRLCGLKQILLLQQSLFRHFGKVFDRPGCDFKQKSSFPYVSSFFLENQRGLVSFSVFSLSSASKQPTIFVRSFIVLSTNI